MLRNLMMPVALLAAFGSAIKPTRVDAAEPPNLLFIVTDDQRPDTIGALGNSVIRTPNLDRMVSTGVTFNRAYAGYPICHVSRAQILTGCHAFTALPGYPGGKIDPSLATLAGTLEKAGYHTAYSGKWHNDGHPMQRGYAVTGGLYSSGGARGIDLPEVDDRGRPLTGYRGWTFKDIENRPELTKGVGLRPDNSRHITEGAIEVLRAAPKEKPFFLHVNYAFPHDPRQWPEGMRNAYSPDSMPLPKNFAPQHPFDHGNLNGRDERLVPKPLTEGAVREELALYYAMISDIDHQLGRLLEVIESLGRMENTFVVFTSDQGLAIGSHGLLGKQNQYEHSIRSPLIITGPGIPANERSDALVNLNDLFPTFCEIGGAAIPETVESKSLLPLLGGEVKTIHDFVAGEFLDSQRMICDRRWKYIFYPKAGREQLFDLERDPDETNDLSRDPRHAAKLDAMRNRLERWRRRQGDPNL
jgi:arylsulfatase A-like enzyme